MRTIAQPFGQPGGVAPSTVSPATVPTHITACEHPRASTTTPRRLCVARRDRPDRPGTSALLDVQVASCAGFSEDVATPALICMFGELSVITIDEVVSSSVLDYAVFAHSIVLDLTHVEFVDECGAGLIDELHRVVSGVGGHLTLHNPGPMVEHVLRFCGISDQIVICHLS